MQVRCGDILQQMCEPLFVQHPEVCGTGARTHRPEVVSIRL
eukprot:COSAG06_NODE_63122_length_263_cov_0.628049_1_plen_40_part_10